MAPGIEDKLKKKKAEKIEQQGKKQYEKVIAGANQYQENITSGTIRVTKKERLMSRGEELRYMEKARLINVLEEYSEAVQGDPKLEMILEAVRHYAKMDVTSVTAGYSEENKIVNSILAALRNYQKELDKQALESKHENLTDFARQKVVASLLTQMEYNTDGNLVISDPKGINKEKREPGAYYVDGTKSPFAPKSDKYLIDINRKDRPLFPHEPCANDISQGYLGDCYFVASLAEIADRQPEKIKDAMKDNGDGTVTVRLYATEKGKDNKYTYKPVYVTVDKVVPSNVIGLDDAYAEDCMWVQTLERAYVASGLYPFLRTSEAKTLGFYDSKEPLHQMPVPENIEQMYQDYKSGNKPMPTHDECPWLVDKNGNLHEWNPSYMAMAGGLGGFAMQAFLGPDYVPATYYFAMERNAFYRTREHNKPIVPSMDIVFTIFDEIYLESKKGASRSEIIAYNKLETSTKQMANVVTMYEKIMGEPCPMEVKNNPEKKFSVPTPDFITYPELLNFFTALSDLNELVADKISQAGDFGDKFKELFNDPEKGIHSVIEKCKNKIVPLPSKGDKKIDIDKLLNGLEEVMTERINKVNERYSVYPKYSGQYNGLEKELLKRVQDSKNSGKMMLCGTGTKDVETDLSFGLRKTHQYTAIDSVKRTVNGKELWFVRLRNPHAQNVMKYTVENGTMTPKESEQGEAGYFDIELSDFANNFTEFIYGEPSPERLAEIEEQKKEAEQKQNSVKTEQSNEITNEEPQVEPEELSDDTARAMEEESKKLHAYDRALESIQKALEGTHSVLSNDSQQFKDLEKAIIASRRYLAGANGEKETPDLKAALGSIKAANQEYQQHVKDVKSSGSRRANRVEISNAIDKLVEMEKLGLTDPKKAMKTELGEKMIQCAERALAASKKPEDIAAHERLKDKAFSEQKVNEIVNNKKLEKEVGSDFVSLFNASKKPDKDMIKLAKQIVPKQENAPEKDLNKTVDQSGKTMKSGLY